MNQLVITPFELQLNTSIQTSPHHRISSRAGFQVLIRDTEMNTGRGECNPLPGFHVESREDCLSQVQDITAAIQMTPLRGDQFNLRSRYFNLLDVPGVHPALEYAIEEALLTWYLTTQSNALEDLFQIQTTTFSCLVNGLFLPDENSIKEIAQLCQNIREQGFKTLKIKVGRLEPHYEIKVVRALSRTLGPDFKLRLDGNRLFDRAKLLDFTRQLEDLNIEYFEDPAAGTSLAASDLAYNDVSIPIGLDESVQTYLIQLERGIRPPASVEALVIKPTTLGGIHRTVQIIDLCREHQLKCVLSSAFDSGWTIATFTLLAQLVRPEIAMGFDTYRFLKSDTLRTKLNFTQGRIQLPSNFWLDHRQH